MKNGIRFHLCMALCVVMLASFSAFAQSSNDVKIGKQIWMSKNLDVSTFRNGDPIPQAKNKEEWNNAGDNKQPAWCYYKFDDNNGKKYGKLYNWFAVSDSRGLAPKGYHVPSDEEWNIIVEFLGGEIAAGRKMKSKEGWNYYDKDALGDNSSGFSGLPGGYCYDMGCTGIGQDGNWWSSSKTSSGLPLYISLSYNRLKINRNYGFNPVGKSVRCIKD